MTVTEIFLGIAMAVAVGVICYLCKVNTELDKRADFNAQAAAEWMAHAKDCLALAEGSRVRHVETGKVYTVFGHQINHGQTEEWEPRLELLVYMYDQFGYVDASWFEPIEKE